MKCRKEPKDELEARIRSIVPQMDCVEIAQGPYSAVSGLMNGIPTIAYVRSGGLPENNNRPPQPIHGQPAPPQDRTVPEERPQQLPPAPESAKLVDYGPVGSSVPPEIRDLMEEGETIAQAKTRITQLLWVEQAELRQLQGKKGENLKREGEIEFLLGLLARLSD